MSQTKKAAMSVVIIAVFSIGSKVLGFIREALIAARFGSGVETDTFFIALSAISLFSSTLMGSINTTMIPVLSEVEATEGKRGKISHTANLLNITLVLSFGIVALGWVLAPYALKVLAVGFEGDQLRFAVSMMRIGLPAMIFSGVVGVFRGYLQSELMFAESAAANFPFNFTYIFFLVFLSGVFGIRGLMVTSVLAVGSQILIQIPGIRKTGFKYEFKFDIRDKYVDKILYLVPPVIMSVAINDLNKIVDKALASTLVDGSISALNYANRLDSLSTGIFISAITTVIYPMLSKEAHSDDYDGLKKVMIRGINVVLLITVPAMVGMMVLAKPIVKVAFERGAFDARATAMTVGALVYYSVGLVGSALKTMLNRVFYSLQDTKTPMVNGFIAVAFNIVLNLIFIRFMAHRGLALATSISAIITSGLLLRSLRDKIGPFGFMKSVECGAKSLAASAVMGVAVYYLKGILPAAIGTGPIQELISLLLCAGIGATIYSVITYMLKAQEMLWLVGIVREKLKRKS